MEGEGGAGGRMDEGGREEGEEMDGWMDGWMDTGWIQDGWVYRWRDGLKGKKTN